MGSAVWGIVASHFGVGPALLCAGFGTLTMASLGLFLHLPEATVDLTSWNHWRMPSLENGTLLTEETFGPVLVTVEYQVAPDKAAEFLRAIRRYARIRRRDGARRWGIYRDIENVQRYVETFIVASWAEHLRQHDRLTLADREAEELVQRYVISESKVRHLISVATTRTSNHVLQNRTDPGKRA